MSDPERDGAKHRIGTGSSPAQVGRQVDTELCKCDGSRVMKTVNALQLRQSLGKVLDQIQSGGKPILVCRRSIPAAALISLKDYRERFVDREADDRRREAVARLRQIKFESPAEGTTLDLLRSLRS